MRRLTPTTQLKISAVSDHRFPNGGTVLAHLQHDAAKYSTEYIYSTDSALLGFRGLYNFGPPPIPAIPPHDISEDPTVERANVAAALAVAERSSHRHAPQGRISAGGEVYYGLLNKSGGASAGLRFTTLPSRIGFPYTMTATVNPLMGNLSVTHSVLASRLLAFSSQFDFNAYSYESEFQVGTEIWRRKMPAHDDVPDINWARRKMGLEPVPVPSLQMADDEKLSGCLKARMNQRGKLAVLWEGRVKELLYTCGLTVDLKGGENMFTGVGVELRYSS